MSWPISPEALLKAVTTAAGIAMTLSYYPQIWRLIRTKNAGGLSLATYFLFGFGTVVWTVYGILNRDLMIFLSFAPGAIGSWAMIFLIFRFRRNG